MPMKVFFLGGIDSWRMMSNTDYGMPLVPEKKYPRRNHRFPARRGRSGKVETFTFRNGVTIWTSIT